MASNVIYPAIVDSATDAFVSSESCRVYFSLSKFNTFQDIQQVHASVNFQDTGISVLDTKLYPNGIVLNLIPQQTEESNLYYVDITPDMIQLTEKKNENGDVIDSWRWKAGTIYKIQLRLSAVVYKDVEYEAEWLTQNADSFSEWSTITVTKAIGVNYISIPALQYTEENTNVDKTLYLSTLDLEGKYKNEDETETLYSYRVKLLSGNEVLEDSQTIYTDQYINPNIFKYIFKTELEDGIRYSVSFEYTTLNNYSRTITIPFDVANVKVADLDIYIQCEEASNLEEDEGRMGLKLYSPSGDNYTGNVVIRRTDSKSNFRIWEDIKIFTLSNENPNDLDIIYDYTIESGVWYKYGIQSLSLTGHRGYLNEIEKPVKREFNFSFLLGENNQQLALRFDDNMQNFKYAYAEGRTDTIGSKYSFITRNGNMSYRTFPITGLISFNMDENHLFLPKDFTYGYTEDTYISMYDYSYEKEFRNEVMKFLYDGKPKLFKSPTEGNVMVRLMEVSFTPNNQLDRMIYSFTSNAYEIAGAAIEDCIANKLLIPGAADEDYTIIGTEWQLGQYIGTIVKQVNIIDKIIAQHNTPSGETILGKVYNVKKIKNLEITFENLAATDLVNNELYTLSLGDNNTIQITSDVMTFGEVEFLPTDTIVYTGSPDIQVNITYTYELEESFYVEREIASRMFSKVMGQVAGHFTALESLYSDIEGRYYYVNENSIYELYQLAEIDIEAVPGAVFYIQESTDDEVEYIDMNSTGILHIDHASNITDIQYMGMRLEDGSIDTTKTCDVLLNYFAFVSQTLYA